MVYAECGWLYRLSRSRLAVEALADVELEWQGPTECGHCGAMLLDDTPVRGIRGTARVCCATCFERAGGAGRLAELGPGDPNQLPN